MLFWAQLASRQIIMRIADGWKTLNEKPSDPAIGPVTPIIAANSSSHFLAAFGAAAAGIRAFFHFTYAVAIRGALFTDFAAQATCAFV